ncbi:MAG: hypothetical protein QOE43_1057 [Gaiellaceae bacterium]|jgi:hypothetical protein|nr:hypothetical protein [Gaiellaceae bacterium]
MRRILKASALLAAVTLVAVTGAGAAVSPSYQVAGIGIGGPQANGTQFTGSGVGSAGDRARWQASVTYDALANCTTVGSSCALTGGTFTLRSQGSQLNESVSGGSFQLQNAAPGCGRQQFAVTANLTGDSSLALTGTVTTYRFQWRGQCVVLAATLQGSLAPASTDSGGGGGIL